MTLATLRNSFNALNKIIIYRRGISPFCVHVTLLYTACYVTLHCILSWSSPRTLSVTQTQANVQNISTCPVYLYCDLKCRLVPRIATLATPIPEFSIFIPYFFRLFLPYFPAERLHVYHWKFRRLLIFLSILILSHIVLILGFSFFWDLTQRRMVVCYRHFGTA